jgi:glycosyltransferase involved in cell wall biosynthesis
MPQTPKSRTSIALATYQSARYLREQLDSYSIQARLPDELVVSDDHSIDGTQAIIEDFRNSAPFPVTLVSNSCERGIQANFENALRHCSGEIILFSDHDDVWLSHHVERLATALEADERILAASSDSEMVDSELNRLGYTFAESERYPRRLYKALMRVPENQLELFVRQRVFNGHGIAFRRSLLPFVVPFPPGCLHDLSVLVLAAAIGRVTYIDEPLTLYRIHPKQTHGSERKSLAAVATTMRNQFGGEEHLWSALLDRFREFPDLGLDHDYSDRLLEEKLEFVKRRTRNRKRRLPLRLLCTTSELLRGRYHRLGRGFITFARDLYGIR